MTTLFPFPVVVSVSSLSPLLIGDTIRQRIMDRLALRLQQVTLANGYATDCGTSVNYGQLELPEPEDLPSIYYWDTFENNAPRYGANIYTLTVNLQCYDFLTEDDLRSLSRRANRMLGDIKQAFPVDEVTQIIDETFKGLAKNIKYVQGDLITGLGPERWVGIDMSFEINYSDMIGNPYKIPKEE